MVGDRAVTIDKAILMLHPIPEEEQFDIEVSSRYRVISMVTDESQRLYSLLIAHDARLSEVPPKRLHFRLMPLDALIDWDWTNDTVMGVVIYQGEPRCLMQRW